MDRYEKAAHDKAVYQARLNRVFAEMRRDPSSKYHGSSYTTKPGCPCTCGKCEARREEYRAAQRERNRRYRAGRVTVRRPRVCPFCHEYPEEYDTELGYTIRCKQEGHEAAAWGVDRRGALKEWNRRGK